MASSEGLNWVFRCCLELHHHFLFNLKNKMNSMEYPSEIRGDTTHIPYPSTKKSKVNIHECVALPPGCKDVGLVKGKYKYYHYVVDGVDDTGWGCGYRSLQTLCSWVCYALGDQSKNKNHTVPSLREIQQVLVNLEDKPPSFLGSKEWIGSYEVFLILDQLYDVSSKILHVESGCKVVEKAREILNHFVKFGSPVMIGGDNDTSSKTLLGVCCTEDDQYYFLIADPHFVGKADVDVLLKDSWLQWKKLQDVFIEGSFYNFCLPQLRYGTNVLMIGSSGLQHPDWMSCD